MSEPIERGENTVPTDAQRAVGDRFRAAFELYLSAIVQRAWSDEHLRGALRRRHIDIDSALGRRVQRDAWNRRALAVEEINCWTEGWYERIGSVTSAPAVRVGPEHVDHDALVGVPRSAHFLFRPSVSSARHPVVRAIDVCVPARELTAGIAEIPADERSLYVHRLAAFGDQVIAGVHAAFVGTNRALSELRAPRPLEYDELHQIATRHFVQLDLLRPVEPPSRAWERPVP